MEGGGLMKRGCTQNPLESKDGVVVDQLEGCGSRPE